MDLGFTVRILKPIPELDVSSCGDTESDARRNIADAVQGFLETVREQGTLNEILQEAASSGRS